MRTLQLRGCLVMVAVLAQLGARSSARAEAKAGKGKASRACSTAYKEAQELERDNRLREAEKSWLTCAKAACGAFLKHECTFRHTQVQGDIPSVIPVITDAAGAPMTDAQVAMDGQLLATRIDGRAVQVDPGVHDFVFKNGGGQLGHEKVVISQGQRNRLITVSLRPTGETALVHGDGPSAASIPPVGLPPELKPTALDRNAPAAEESGEAPPRRHSGGSVAPYLLGTVGVAGLAGFGLMTYWGRKDNDRLAACTPNCSPATVDHIHKLYLGANIALGVGVAALVGAAWVALSGSGPNRDEAGGHGRYVLQMQPLEKGAAASLGGTF